MVKEVLINQFNGTPLYALAQNANVNGGDALSKTEFSIMQKQMKNLGMTFEEYGLKISTIDSEGKNAKETRNNVAEIGSELNKAYKKQFGSKNDVNVAQTAELKADAIIKTALDIFNSEHPDVIFFPKSLGARPQFTQPQYKDKATLYAMDLSDWANGVKLEYINATKLSNEALVAMIIDNANANADILSNEMLANTNALLESIEDGTAEVINTVRNSEGNIIKTVRTAEGHIVKVVQDSTNRVISVVKEEGAKTRNTVKEVGADIINDNRFEHANTRGLIIDEAAKTRDTVRFEGYKNKQITKRTAKETQELETMNTAIAERVSTLTITTAWPSISVRVGDMQKQIAKANIPHSVKMELLQRIRNQLSETYTSDSELNELQEIIDKRIKETQHRVSADDFPPMPETPTYPSGPDYIEPIYEKTDNETSVTQETNKKNKKEECTKPKEKDYCDNAVPDIRPETTEKKITNSISKILNKK